MNERTKIEITVIARPKAEAIQKATGKKLDCFVVPVGLLAMTGMKVKQQQITMGGV